MNQVFLLAKRRASVLTFCLLGVACLAFAANVSTRVTESDVSAFQSVLKLKRPEKPLDYRGQIALITDVQRLVLKVAPLGDGIPERRDREPADLLRNGVGLCYDRSRTFDKLFDWLGFTTRHVYILYPEDPVTGTPMPYWRTLLTRGTHSHAMTEVKTLQGWLVVDSNSPWISVTVAGQPVDADGICERLAEFRDVPGYLRRPYLVVRGLYSRRGQLYRPFVPLPDVNWWDFSQGMFERTTELLRYGVAGVPTASRRRLAN